MKKPRLLAFVLLVFSLSGLAAQTPRLVPLASPQLWQPLEFRIEEAPSTTNNFDPDLIRIDATFVAPSGKTAVVPAFWYQDFTRALGTEGQEVLTAAGTGEWRIRYTPTEPGGYRVSLRVAGKDRETNDAATPGFQVAASTMARQHGWVRTAPDQRYFETTDGKPLRLVGENVCWSGSRGTFDFDQWFEGMAASGQNFARLWLSPWSLNLEHTPGTLNRYNLESAWMLDHVFRLAESKGIYLLVCFDHHGMYQVDNQNWGGTNNFWKTNPYNAVLGGPCENPNAFFTDAEAKAIYQKRLRYLVGRYGYSEYLLAWQFFNEIDNVYAPRQTLVPADVAQWHREMGQWFRAHDPYRHLVTTSLTGGSDREDIWTLPEMDFSMYHSYADPAPARKLSRLSDDFVRRYQKPSMVGEFGVNAREWSIATDPHLRGFRQALWGTALGGSVGTAMTWWWEDIHIDRVYPLFGSLQSILRRAGWYEGQWTPLVFADDGELGADVAAALPRAEPFNASLPLAGFQRAPLRGQLGLADRLAAERASEYLCAYLHGSKNAALQSPFRIAAHFGETGKLQFRVNSVASDLELLVRIDGAEVQRTRFFDRDGQAVVNGEINRDLVVNIPAGKHLVEIVNTGLDWAVLENVRVSNIRPSAYATGQGHHLQAIGLAQSGTNAAVVYVHSAYVTYPAGAFRYNPPPQTNQTLTIQRWTGGAVTARWFDPVDAREVGRTEGRLDAGNLVVPVPTFGDDLVAVLAPASTSVR